jgi:RNA polymerase sigma factor for flagellar operon FliA
METTALWTQYKQSPTDILKKQLLLCYTNLVHYVIHHSKFVNLNIFESRDYFQFGIEGLSEAVERFDPEFGTKFETYAIQRIRGKIIDELRRAQIKPRFSPFDEPGEQYYKNVSMDRISGSEENVTLHEMIPAEVEIPDETAEKNDAKERLMECIKELSERERTIITLYYFEHLNYREISEVIDITVSRISQIHARVISSLKEKLQEVGI